MTREYKFEVTIKFTQFIEAQNKKEAVELLKDSFADGDYRLDICDDEITLLQVEKTLKDGSKIIE
jgi:hypothetical protein